MIDYKQPLVDYKERLVDLGQVKSTIHLGLVD